MIDVNDEVPWFEETQYEAQISENQPSGTSVLTVSASDLDQGQTLFVCMCAHEHVHVRVSKDVMEIILF